MLNGTKNYFLIHGDPLLMGVCENNITKEISKEQQLIHKRIEGKDIEDEYLIYLFRSKGIGRKRIIYLANPTLSQKDLILNALPTIEKNPTLYFIISCLEIEKNSKFYKNFNKTNQVIECVSPYNEYGKENPEAVEYARSWIDENLNSLGIKFENYKESTETLLYRSKYNVGILGSELEKIRLCYNSVNRPLTTQDIIDISPNSSEISVFGLITSLECGNYNQTLSILNALVREREVHPESIFNSLLLKSRTWLMMKKYLDDGIREPSLIRDCIKQNAVEYGQEGIVPPHPYVLKVACDVSKRMSSEQLIIIYDFLYDAQLTGRKKSYSIERRYQLLLEFVFIFYGLQKHSILLS